MDTFLRQIVPKSGIAFLLVILFALFSESSPQAAEGPGQQALADGYETRYRIRVCPASWKGATLMPDDPKIAGNVVGRPGKLPDELVVVQTGRMPRVIVEDGPVRALLYYQTTSLKSVIVKSVVLAPAPDKAAEVTRAALVVGSAVERLEARDGFVRIQTSAGESGWVKADAVGKMYLAPKNDSRKKTSEKLSGYGHGESHPNRVSITKGSWLRDGPDGAVVALVKQNNTFFADNYIEPGGWLRLRYYSSWGELGLWLNVNELAFREGTFGDLSRKGKLFWLDRDAGRTVCIPWKIKPSSKNDFVGQLIRPGKDKLTYKYEYAMGMLTLTGPLGIGSGSFEVLEIMSCGSQCLQVGGNRWYFSKKVCEADRIKGVR